jgi:predicted RNA-binding Zn ribbon-like protein
VDGGWPMSGHYAAGPQSGGRPAGPGRLAFVQAFVNSFFDLEEHRGQDLFATPIGLQRWLEQRGLSAGKVSRADIDRVLVIREGLRAEFATHNGAPPDPARRAALREETEGLSAAFTLDENGDVAPAPACAGVAGALGLLLAVTHESQTAGTWRRLKACPGHDCGWVFFDSSRNAGGTWCSMQVCGNREKARAYRRRSRLRAQP